MDDIFDMLMQEIEQGAVPLFFRAGGVPPKPAERIRALSMAGGAFGRQGKSPFGAGPCGGRVYGYLGAGGYDASCPCCGHPPDPSVLKQKRPCPQMETKAVEKPLRYHSNSVKTHREQAKRDNTALVRPVTGTSGGAYWRSCLRQSRWVRGSQGIFAGPAPPPSHRAGGSLGGGFSSYSSCSKPV